MQLTVRGTRMRLAATIVVFGVLLAGTAWGQDDHFPFGPFKMYATTQPRDGETKWFRVEAVNVDGERVSVLGPGFGMRRAELEGRYRWYAADPARLVELADAYAERYPDAPALGQIELIQYHQRLDDGRPVGEPTSKLVARWTQR